MDTFVLVLSILLIVACWGTAYADFARQPRVLKTLHRLGIPQRMLPVLGVAKAAGGLGLLIGQWNEPLLIFSALCVTAYFAAATWTHVRARDSVPGTAPAAVLLILGLILVVVAI